MELKVIDPDDPASEHLSEPVKLIVWDLDETLWSGILSEGPVLLDQSRIDLVRALNRRGIINAISSKNEPGDARARLEQDGLWDEFVFARIGWSPKGPQVAQIIEDTQLRPESVLFIDDHPLNRGEARHFAPGIQTAGPEILDRLLGLPELAGKDDHELTRLQQYRMLEQKLADRQAMPATTEAFLRSCDITIGVYYDTESEMERLFELVNRTHQLNFTKRRPSRKEFGAMVTDPRHDTGYVRVRDRYGDYGICGFYSRSPGDGTLDDFLFSCRVLHMGVEQWMYDHLGRPPLSVVGDVASSLDETVDWITMDTEGCDVGRTADVARGREGDGTPTQPDRVLMVGGCDLITAAQFLGGQIATQFAHTGPTGAFIHVGHTELLRQSVSGLSDQQRTLVRRIPFLDEQVFRSPAVVAPDYDVLVYSVLTDYTQGLYRHRGLGLVIPWYQLDWDITDPAIWPSIEVRFAREGIDREFLVWFAQEFESIGGISAGSFQDNVRWLAESIPPEARLVLLNGAEVPFDNPNEPNRHLRHQIMNAALADVTAALPNATVCDVRTFVLTADDLRNNIRHYRRHAYLRMAEEIRATGSSELVMQRQGLILRAFHACYRYAGRQRVRLRRLAKRLRQLS
ncbi:MAG: HAD-IIIC family phosphatase [Acidimicrobiales bacterium]